MTNSSKLVTQDRRVNIGLLVLRVGLGASLLLIFGLQKLQAGWAFFHTGQWQFVDFNRKMGLPAPVLVAYLQTLNESVAALLLAGGFLTRYAAASLALGFAVATYCSIKAAEPAWLIAAYICIISVTFVLTGPGKFSIDSLLESRAGTASESPAPGK